MSIWVLIPLVLYLIGVIGFLIAIYIEAPKHGTDVGVPHYLVAIGWPLWVIWYIWAVVTDYIQRKRK